jgi:hypothetical protein
MVSPRLVDVSCEVWEGLCRDILCLVQWVGIKHAVGPSGVGERPRTEMREGTCVGSGRVATNAVHGSASSLDAEGRIVGRGV